MLKGRVALVTGGQQGIGAAAAIALAKAGADVAINYLDDEDAAQSVADAVAACGQRSVLIQADLSRHAGAARLVADAHSALGSLDVLVNNAAIFPATDPLEVTEDEWDRVMAVNLKGTFFCAQAAARLMIAAGRGGSIINLSSVVTSGARVGPHYVASKGAIVSLTRSLASAFAKSAIRVNAVAPGLIDTAQPRAHMSQAQLDAAAEHVIPWKRLGRAEEVAELIVYLAGPAADYVTGQTIHINGGQLMA